MAEKSVSGSDGAANHINHQLFYAHGCRNLITFLSSAARLDPVTMASQRAVKNIIGVGM
jgi:hypothetical protein